MSAHVTFLGSGDAFGSGGRLHTAFLVRTPEVTFLIDCGASVLCSMRRFGCDPKSVRLILLTHLHGDHFAGLPFFILDAQVISKRTTALTIAGPVGTRERLWQAMDVLFPGSSRIERGFPVEILELEALQPRDIEGIRVTPYPVNHAGVPAFALRMDCQGTIITYSGDTEWTDMLVAAARDADLFIAEAYTFEKPVRFHLDYQTLRAHLDDIRPRRLILTHMAEDMLSRVKELDGEFAEDGMTVRIP